MTKEVENGDSYSGWPNSFLTMAQSHEHQAVGIDVSRPTIHRRPADLRGNPVQSNLLGNLKNIKVRLQFAIKKLRACRYV